MSPTAIAALVADAEAGSLSVDNPAVADVTLDDFVLDGRPMDADVRDGVDDIAINRSIGGASTLTVMLGDPQLELLNSEVLNKAVDVWLDDLAFRLADVDLEDDDEGPGLSLVFEARAVARLRMFDEPMAASRADKTRAEFIKAMCDEADVPFVCPQLHKRQPIKKKTDRESRRRRDERRDPGIKATAAITVKGQPADSEQRSILERNLDVAHSHKSGDLAAAALVVALIQESAARNLAGGDASSSGDLQVLAETAAGLGIDPRDVEAVADVFLDKGFFGNGGALALEKKHPDWTPGKIAQAVQGSAYPNAYDVWKEEAEKILKAYGRGDVFAGAEVEEYAEAYMFRRGSEDGATEEDSWVCMRRLAAEVNWRLWEDAGTVYYMTDDDILRSRVRHTITPGAEGIDSVTGRISTRKPLQEVTVRCHARRWQAPPATVCEIEGYGRFDGRWITATINRTSVFATDTTITLHRRQKAKLEPPHDMRTRSTASDGVAKVVGNTVAGGTLRDKVVTAATRAAELSKNDPKYYHYDQRGAWKNDLFLRDDRDDRSDCSSFVIQCYVKAGCKLPVSLQGQGFTGSLADAAKKVAVPKPGDICLYGTYPYDHVELYVGGGKTIGHGSARIDADTPKNPALGAFAGYFTFDFLDADTRQPERNSLLSTGVNGQARPN